MIALIADQPLVAAAIAIMVCTILAIAELLAATRRLARVLSEDETKWTAELPGPG